MECMAKGAILMSGGIDSPVAAEMVMSQGHQLIAVHMDNRPFTDESPLGKAVDHVRALERKHGVKIPLYVVPHGQTQMALMRNTDRHYGCILCRRFMWRSAERIAEREGATFLVTGESLGQVASQTLSNIHSATSAVRMPIVRPLIGLDKKEIEEKAVALGTYGISTRPGLCCQAVPDRPATRSTIALIEKEEAKVDVERLVTDVIARVTVL
jgi:thiamine biosynthesis protein ThiI